MSKEYLEALEGMFDLITSQGSFEKAQKYYYILEEALERLEAIDKANPSEALECLEKLLNGYSKGMAGRSYYDTIKQALLKTQANARSEEILQKYYQEGITLDSVRALKQEKDNYKKVLEIVFKKNVDMLLIKKYDNASDYNSAVWLSGREKLTEEEFDLLKEGLEYVEVKNER